MAYSIENKSPATPILYLDLDGTVRKGYDELGRFVNKREDVEVFPEAVERMKEYREAGYRIVGITNQGGVALGHMSWVDMQDAIFETNKQCKNMFDKIMACVHHPAAEDKEMAVCWCRKPKIGNIVEGAINLGTDHPGEYYPPHMALFVGDREEDKQCAENAGIEFMWASDWRNKEKQ